jgi:hypothetical protein
VFVVGTWVLTVLIIAWLIRGIARAAINKADAKDLPQVLATLAPMLGGLVRTVTAARRSSTKLHNCGCDADKLGSGEDGKDG